MMPWAAIFRNASGFQRLAADADSDQANSLWEGTWNDMCSLLAVLVTFRGRISSALGTCRRLGRGTSLDVVIKTA